MKKPIISQGDPLDETEMYEKLFVFIDDVLFRFSTDESEEDKITQDLEMLLTEETRVKDTFFAFQNQHKEGIFTVDIGVHLRSSQEPFCWIEAKRLPTPKRNNRDEREYVIVSQEKKKDGTKKFKGNGGIQRFKEGKYAPKLEYSIMIGYIQDGNNTDYWLSKINLWIRELAKTNDGFWSNEDCLGKVTSSKCNRFSSKHERKGKTAIELQHYWLKLT